MTLNFMEAPSAPALGDAAAQPPKWPPHDPALQPRLWAVGDRRRSARSCPCGAHRVGCGETKGETVNELAILDALQTWHSSVLDGLVAAFTSTSNHGELWILLGIALVCFRRTRKAGVGVLAAVALGAVVTNLLVKPLIMRPRPCDVNAAVTMIVPRPSGSSFPSGHATAAFAAAAALWFTRDPKAPGALVAGVTIAAVLMGLSRMYCYVHYPTDVLAGALVGTLAGLTAAHITDALAKRRQATHTSIPRGPDGSGSARSDDDTPSRRGPGSSA